MFLLATTSKKWVASLSDRDAEAAAKESISQDLGRSSLRGSTLLLFGRIASMVLTVSTQVILVRALSKTEFGAFAFALAITSACRILLSLGQGRTLGRSLAMYEEYKQYDRLFGALALVVITIVGTSLLLFGVFAGFGQVLVGSLGAPDAWQILVILLLLAPMEALDEALGALFAVFAKPMSIFVRRYVLTPGLRFVTVVLLFALDSSAIFVAVGYVATSLIGLSLYAFLVGRLLRERRLLQHLKGRRSVTLPVRDVFSFSLPSLTNDFLYLSMQTGSVLFLAHYWGAQDVADYRAVFPAGRLNQFIYTSFTLMYLPMVTRLFARRERESLLDAYWHAAVFLAVFSFPVFAMTVPFAEETTLLLFGDRYASAAVLLALLSVGYYFNACLGFNSQTLQVVGRVRYMLMVNLSCGVLNLALAFLLVPQFAALGVAIANATVLIFQNLLNQIGLSRTLRMPFIRAGYRRPYWLIAGMTGLLISISLLFHPPFWVALPISALAWLVVLMGSRRELDMSATFPEILRIPGLRRVLR